MERLQCNFTTPEQSKRLLELGVPADSADCYINLRNNYPYGILFENESYSDYKFAGDMNDSNVLPCWSVGRLMEIYVIVRGLDISYLPIERGEDMVKYLIRLYEEKAKDMDFSKLEE